MKYTYVCICSVIVIKPDFLHGHDVVPQMVAQTISKINTKRSNKNLYFVLTNKDQPHSLFYVKCIIMILQLI